MKRKITKKLFIFALIPAIVLFSVLEFSLRALKKFIKIDSQYFWDSETGLNMEDSQLFWKMKPNVNMLWQGVSIKTNSLGLRDNETPIFKKEDAFRILSLGESTTFGAKVEFEKIYSEVLEQRLNNEQSNYVFEVINAGVSGYTSFQSLVYLKKEGLKLKPDMILIYHENNDSLLVKFGNRGNIIALTDRQLYKLINYFGAPLYYLNKSAIYDLMKNFVMRLRIFLLKKGAGKASRDAPNSLNSLDREATRRVPMEDRKQIFKEFLEISRNNNIALIIIHPIYRTTVEHQCFLTEFAAQNNIPLIETFGAFQNSGYSKDELFYDNMHPTALGHRLIADCIFRYIEALLAQTGGEVEHYIRY